MYIYFFLFYAMILLSYSLFFLILFFLSFFLQFSDHFLLLLFLPSPSFISASTPFSLLYHLFSIFSFILFLLRSFIFSLSSSLPTSFFLSLPSSFYLALSFLSLLFVFLHIISFFSIPLPLFPSLIHLCLPLSLLPLILSFLSLPLPPRSSPFLLLFLPLPFFPPPPFFPPYSYLLSLCLWDSSDIHSKFKRPATFSTF